MALGKVSGSIFSCLHGVKAQIKIKQEQFEVVAWEAVVQWGDAEIIFCLKTLLDESRGKDYSAGGGHGIKEFDGNDFISPPWVRVLQAPMAVSVYIAHF
jgi:hypothetical protein